MLSDEIQVLRIVHHHGRVFPAALKDDALQVRIGGVMQEAAAGRSGTGKAHHVDVVMQANGLADLFARAGHNVEDPGGYTGFKRQLSNAQRGQ
ncbi:hypothetical protein D3C71_1930230 [compost metagenome]